MKKILITYGTETGNSELLSLDTSNIAKNNGFDTTVMGMDEIELEDLKSCENLIIVCSFITRTRKIYITVKTSKLKL